MAKAKKKAPKAGASSRKLYTLTQVSQEVGISMPTLQRYKKLYQDRIPSEGEGRKQRYPKEALKVFALLKVENMARRGRPRKDAVAGSAAKLAPKKAAAKQAVAKKAVAKKAVTRKRATKKVAAKKAAPRKGAARKPAAAAAPVLSLAQIERLTGISYPTLLRYVKRNLAAIPHVGEGRKRRYLPDAVEVLNEMRQQSSQGRRRVVAAGERAAVATRGAVKSAVGTTAQISAEVGQRIQALEKAQTEISKQIKSLISELTEADQRNDQAGLNRLAAGSCVSCLSRGVVGPTYDEYARRWRLGAVLVSASSYNETLRRPTRRSVAPRPLTRWRSCGEAFSRRNRVRPLWPFPAGGPSRVVAAG